MIGGNFNVLSTEIFFAVVGPRTTRAEPRCWPSCCSAFTLGAFVAHNGWLGAQLHHLSGKGDAGLRAPTSAVVLVACFAAIVPWCC